MGKRKMLGKPLYHLSVKPAREAAGFLQWLLLGPYWDVLTRFQKGQRDLRTAPHLLLGFPTTSGNNPAHP